MVRHGTVDVAVPDDGPRVSITYDEMGNLDAPLLLFIHGLAGWRDLWTLVIGHESYDDICRRYRCVAIDLPGFGDSDEIDTPYSIDFMAHVVSNVIEALGEESAIVVGNSLGAAISLSLTLDYPERVSAVVVQGPPIAGENFHKHEKTFLEWWIKQTELIPDIIEDLPVKVYKVVRVVNPIREIRLKRLLVSGEGMRLTRIALSIVKGAKKHHRRANYDMIRSLFECDLQGRLDEITVPILGTDGFPAYRPVDTLETIDELLDNSQLKRIVRIDGTGHLAPFIEVEAFAAALDSFLLEVEELSQ